MGTGAESRAEGVGNIALANGTGAKAFALGTGNFANAFGNPGKSRAALGAVIPTTAAAVGSFSRAFAFGNGTQAIAQGGPVIGTPFPGLAGSNNTAVASGDGSTSVTAGNNNSAFVFGKNGSALAGGLLFAPPDNNKFASAVGDNKQAINGVNNLPDAPPV